MYCVRLFVYSRGRGSYRGRGRGHISHFYRQDRNMMQQQHHHHQQQQGPPPHSQHPHQQSSHQAPHSNVPYYDQSMNLMNSNMQTGNQGGYNDPGVYHDTNRYDWIYTFSLNINRQSTELNAFVAIDIRLHMSKALNSLLSTTTTTTTLLLLLGVTIM